MGPSLSEYTQVQAYARASEELINWIVGARALALLVGAVDLGVLGLLETPSTTEQIAADTGMDTQSAAALCRALEAHGVVTRNGDGYRLTGDFALLMSPDAPVPLTNLIDQVMVIIRTLQDLGPSDTYTTMSEGDVLAMAKGAGISAVSFAPHVSADAIGKTMPEVEDRWQAGGHHLEVGCGVGNSLLGIVATYSKLTGVGIEIDALTAAEAEHRAHLMGIADRVELRTMDACDLQDEKAFDTVQWSQFFFPTASRPIVLQAMYRALKPGGYLLMPWLGSISADTAPSRKAMLATTLRVMKSGGPSFLPFLSGVLRDTPGRRRKERRFAAIQRLLFSRWGVPVRTVAELKSEIESAGFTVLRAPHSPASQFAFTRGFLLATREPD